MSVIRQKSATDWVLRILAPADGGVMLARLLLLATIVTLLRWTTPAQVLEGATYVAFACLPELRRRLWQTRHHPVMAGFLPFAGVIVVASFYGLASWHDSISALIGWRRLLLLPLALAVFDDEASKRLVLKVLVVVCLIGAAVSFIGVWLVLPGWPGRGVVFDNYAIQGIVFSLAIIICLVTLLRPDLFAGDRLLGDRRFAAVAIAVLVVDIVFVLTGRSGYVTAIVMPLVIVTLLAAGTWRVKVLAGLGVLICVGVLFVSSTQLRSRVEQAINEIETVDQVTEGTSLGQRVVMWRATVRMIRDHPVFGVGTGGFADGYRPYLQGFTGWQRFESADAHNQFLKVQAEQGIIGLAALFFFIFRALTCPAATPYRQLAIAAMIGWCATSLANSHFSTFVEGRLLYFWLGAMLATQTSAKTP
jgi:O-antigen ligase